MSMNTRKLGKVPTTSSGKRMKRIKTELSSLVTDLPIFSGGSVFVRVDEDRMDCIKFLITGPQDTPYESGCFEFDCLLPANYPRKPPKIQLCTTGGGKTRFNPNIYKDGSVCLSLLGTWAGPGWDEKTSTLLQCLISIQSLIFVASPFYNEVREKRESNKLLIIHCSKYSNTPNPTISSLPAGLRQRS